MKKHILSALVAATFAVAGTAWANGTPAPEAAGGRLQISGNGTTLHPLD